MPSYSNTPPPNSYGQALPIQRTPANRPLKAIITSPDLIGCNTHFWHGQTTPCTAPNCEPCKDASPYRWHAYCSAFIPPTSLHFLYETTAAAAEQLVTYRRANDTLRGCKFTAYRWRQAINGRVVIHTEKSTFADDQLPEAPNLEIVLATLWHLPHDNLKRGDATAFGKQVAHDVKLAETGDAFPPKD